MRSTSQLFNRWCTQLPSRPLGPKSGVPQIQTAPSQPPNSPLPSFPWRLIKPGHVRRSDFSVWRHKKGQFPISNLLESRDRPLGRGPNAGSSFIIDTDLNRRQRNGSMMRPIWIITMFYKISFTQSMRKSELRIDVAFHQDETEGQFDPD